MSAHTRNTVRIALWIVVAAIAAAAVGAYLHLRPAAAPPIAAPAPAPATVSPPPPASAAPAGLAPIPFAPRIHPTTPAPAAEVPSATPASGAGAPSTPQPGATASASPLPRGTPVATVVQRLRAAADAGDAAAACRLGLELLRCANPAQIVSATTRGPQASAAACNGVSPEEVQQGWSYLTRAAGGGSVAAQRVSLARSVEAVSPEDCGR